MLLIIQFIIIFNLLKLITIVTLIYILYLNSQDMHFRIYSSTHQDIPSNELSLPRQSNSEISDESFRTGQKAQGKIFQEFF